MSFGAVNQGTATNDASPGQIMMFCSADKAGVSVSIGGGENATGGQRRMSNGAGGFIPYEIHSDAGRSSPAAIGGTVFSGNVPAASEISIDIYGTVPEGSYPAGSYSDSLVVVFNY